ncbi:MAG: signal recognition particle protein Srp19 [Candidatus Bathyarchaeota archaeon]|nr:signal recognition particle protein Srp19 [Candidatus Bathyarchaeota archaeon]
MRGRGKLRIWPAYFDIRYTRGEGRRVPKDKAIKDPKAEDIEKIAVTLGLNPIFTPGAAYSKHPFRKTGVILVDKKGSKTKIIMDIASNMRK